MGDTGGVFPSYAVKIGLANCVALRKMYRSAAESWLGQFTLTPDELSSALTLTQPDPVLDARLPSQLSQLDTKRMGTAAIWLCGASIRQLGRLYDLAPQTIAQKLERVFRKPLKDVTKLHDEMEFWRADLMLHEWEQISAPELLQVNIYEVATMLDIATPTTNPEADNNEQVD